MLVIVLPLGLGAAGLQEPPGSAVTPGGSRTSGVATQPLVIFPVKTRFSIFLFLS